MKPRVSSELRGRVLELRHRHTLRETATLTGLALGTVKTLCSRSGAFRDNAAHRALFTLPPLRPSDQSLPAVIPMPPQLSQTGDPEIDAVLWLREVIDTGSAALIDKALTAASRIGTPPKELETRYMHHLVKTQPGNDLNHLFATVGFADLETLARRTLERERLRAEAAARFGDDVFNDTDAERFCVEALSGLQYSERSHEFDGEEVAARFDAHPELAPNTLSDCLYELAYWDHLYCLRDAVERFGGEQLPEVRAREGFVRGLLGCKRPRTKTEAVHVLQYLARSEQMDWCESMPILMNLVGMTHDE